MTRPPEHNGPPDQQISAPPPDKAQIVFLQPFKPLGGEHVTALYQVHEGKPEFLTVVSSKGKAVVLVPAGQHLFMSQGFGVSLMKADVEAGKRYYVLSRFVAYVGYQLRPIRTTKISDYNSTIPEFQEWLRTSTVVTPSAAGLAWASAGTTLAQAEAGRKAAWESWLRKTPAEHAQLTLTREDRTP